MILSLTNKTSYSLNPEEGEAVLDAIQRGDKYVILQGDYIMLAAIIAIQDENRFDEAEHLRNGDYRCAFGEWHTRYDKCYGHDPKPRETTAGYFALEADNRDEEEIKEAARVKWEEMREKFARSKSINV